MRYPASEKAEIIELGEQSHLPAKRTLGKLGIPRATGSEHLTIGAKPGSRRKASCWLTTFRGSAGL